MFVPSVHGFVPQLKAGDSWTLSGNFSDLVVGHGAAGGVLNDSGQASSVFTVASNDGSKLIIAEVDTAQYSYTISGNIGIGHNAYPMTPSGTATANNRNIINDTDLTFIGSTRNPQFAGKTNFLVVDPSTLVTGNTITMVPGGWIFPFAGELCADGFPFTLANAVWNVNGNQSVAYGGGNLQAPSVTYTGIHGGCWWSSDAGDSGRQTDTYLYDTTYGVIVGVVSTGTYLGSAQANGSTIGNYTETANVNLHLSSTNLNFNNSSATTGSIAQLLATISSPFTLKDESRNW